MSYVAVAFARTGDSWAGQEVDLDGVDDLDGVAELLVDTASELGGDGSVVLLLEEEEEYVAVVRAEGDADLRVFLSDDRVTATSRIAAILGEELDTPDPVEADEDDEEETSSRPEVESAGDDTLLADLGVPAPRLQKLCATEGMLPADTIYAVCELLGCADLLDEIRGV